MYDRELKSGNFGTFWYSRLQERWREGIRHKVTPLGAMMLVLLFTTGILSFSTSQNVFFLLFSLLLASILISSFVNRLMLAGLEVRLELPAHAMAAEPVACNLVIENRKSWLASFALELTAPVGRKFHVPIIASMDKACIPVEVVWSKRGTPDPFIIELSTRFPFGFSVRRTRVAVRISQALYPSIREQPGFSAVLTQLQQKAARLMQSAEAEFSHLREYRPGDDWRRIAWGKSSKGESWIVKETTSVGEGFLQLQLDTSEASFEVSVALAAYLCWELHYRGIPFHFTAQSASIPVQDRRGAYEVLNLLALLQPVSNAPPASTPSSTLISASMLQDFKAS